jgi:hypothetical protein
MHTKLILAAAGILLFFSGAALAFLPQETAAGIGLAPVPQLTLILQVLSAALLGLGILDWFSRVNLIGGIYGRPLALANFLFFFVSTAALVRAVLHHSEPLLILCAAAAGVVFTAAFAWLLFFHDPVAKKPEERG